ncbi:anti-sigma factor [Microbacterium excoecariae]|uniref:anti-sigma factor n=1 Tax=Microbacterium excoecariae TaxID=2715210 RepID=UPI00140A3684|nr:anti-sigma factor [Microbacterium excoecariae]NHI15911.1 anti-sigma factor [Microbacterium excoecariae]
MNEDEFWELAAGYAVGALSAEEERALLDAAAGDPQRQRILDEMVETSAAFAESIPEVAPPSGIRDALMANLGPQEAPADPLVDAAIAVPADADAPSPAGVTARPAPAAHAAPAPRRHRTLFALAAAVVLVVGIGAGILTLTQTLDRTPAEVALEQIVESGDHSRAEAEMAGGGAVVLDWSAETGTAVLTADGLPEIADDQQFEAWFVRDGAPIPAGVFDGTSEAQAVLEGTMHEGDLVAITVEQHGGSDSGLPTSDPIVAVETAS